MSRTPAKATQADLSRAQRVAEAATKRGVPTIVEMAPDGTIRLVPLEAKSVGPMPVAPARYKVF